MLTLNPASLRATPLDAVPPPGGSNGSSDPAGFASLLRQSQMTPPPLPPQPAPAPTAAAPQPPAEPEATTEPVVPKESPNSTPSPESDTTQRARALLRGKPRPADGDRVAPRDAKPAADTHTDKTATADEGETKTDKNGASADCKAPESRLTGSHTPVDASLMPWLAGLQRAAAGAAAETTAAADGKTAPDATDTGAIETRGAAKSLLAADERADAMPIKAPPADAVIGTSPFAAALAEQPGVVDKPRPQGVESVKDMAAAGASAVSPTPTGGSDAAAPVAVPIAAPVTAPDFAQELGLRLSTLAKDGVQTAELHLNPAEMGPVSVQIVMDGTQARVDFGADMAATRHAIEAGLPELASALADAGFTLAGGGVSQHAGGRSGGEGSSGSNGNAPRRVATPDTLAHVAGAARRIVTQGGIDLFA